MVKMAPYNPPQDFTEEAVDSLVDIDLNDSTELWLIQLPEDHSPDFDGEEVSLKLQEDGQLGSLKGSSGKLYDMLSYSSQESDAMVFLSSSSTPRIAGKISRNISLVHYPEPEEFKAETDAKKQRPFSSATSFTKSRMPSSFSRMPSNSSQTMSQMPSHSPSRSRSTHSGKKSSLFEMGNASKHSKRTSGEPSRFSGHSSGQDSGRSSGITMSGSSEQSERKKSKRRADSEA